MVSQVSVCPSNTHKGLHLQQTNTQSQGTVDQLKHKVTQLRKEAQHLQIRARKNSRKWPRVSPYERDEMESELGKKNKKKHKRTQTWSSE